MKLVRYGEAGDMRPGLIDSEGRLRDLYGIAPDIAGSLLSRRSLDELARTLVSRSLPIVRESPRLGPCVGGVGKVVCVGLNYYEHIREVGAAVPSEPVLFMKSPTALCGPSDAVVIPPGATAVDWEVELAIVMGSRATRIAVSDALAHVAGFCIINDISERNWQLHGTGQWVKGKSADTFGPLGPWLATVDEVPDPQNLKLRLSVNGQIRQQGSTSGMVVKVRDLISYISNFMTLMPGDIISTGTPPGVGMGQRPPQYLQPGDVMELSIDGLGTQRQRCVAAPL